MILILVTDMEMFRVWVEVISAIARIPSPLELWRGACRVTRGMSWVPVVWNSLWSKETRRVELGCVAVPAVSPAGTATSTASQQVVHLPNIASWQRMRLTMWLSPLKLLVM